MNLRQRFYLIALLQMAVFLAGIVVAGKLSEDRKSLVMGLTLLGMSVFMPCYLFVKCPNCGTPVGSRRVSLLFGGLSWTPFVPEHCRECGKMLP